MENLVWALIIVTGAANVNLSTGYPSKALCEDAISIAKTGLTVAEKKAQDEERKRSEDKLDAEFTAEHPDRTATTEDRKNCAIRKGANTISLNNSSCMVDEETNTTHFSRRPWLIMSSAFVSYPERDIKYARCVMVDPKDK